MPNFAFEKADSFYDFLKNKVQQKRNKGCKYLYDKHSYFENN
jgi:hypothetical protein